MNRQPKCCIIVAIFLPLFCHQHRIITSTTTTVYSRPPSVSRTSAPPLRHHGHPSATGPHHSPRHPLCLSGPAVLAVHTPGSWPSPGPRARPSAAGPPASDGEGPEGPLWAVETSVRGRVQPVHGQPCVGGAVWIPGHQGGPRQDGRFLLPQTTHLCL